MTNSFVPNFALGELFTQHDIFRIAEDPKGGVWVHGDYKTGLAIVQDDGTVDYGSTPFKRMADFKTVMTLYPDTKYQGVLWLTGHGGIVRYDSQIPQNYAADFSALIRRVIANSDSLIYGGAPIMEGDTLSYATNAVRFEYAAPSFTDASKNRFQVFLEGFDKNWSAWTDETVKEFTNLSEGHIHFGCGPRISMTIKVVRGVMRLSCCRLGIVPIGHISYLDVLLLL